MAGRIKRGKFCHFGCKVRRVEFVRLQFHGLFTSALLEAATAGILEQFINVLADVLEVNLAQILAILSDACAVVAVIGDSIFNSARSKIPTDNGN